MGRLLTVQINGKDAQQAENISESGIERTWTIYIPKGGEARFKIVHRLWYRSDILHTYTPSRLVKLVRTKVVSDLAGPQPLITATTRVRRQQSQITGSAKAGEIPTSKQLIGGEDFPLPDAINCLPDEIAVSLHFEELPVQQTAGAAALSSAATP